MEFGESRDSKLASSRVYRLSVLDEGDKPPRVREIDKSTPNRMISAAAPARLADLKYSPTKEYRRMQASSVPVPQNRAA
jgi:hypothetical protein